MQLQAKDKAIGIIDVAKREEREMRSELQNIQRRLEKREEMFDQKLLGLEDKKTKLEEKGKQIDDIKEQIQKLREEEAVKLEKMSQLSRDDAKQLLLQAVEDDVKEEGAHRLQELEKMTTTEVETKARTILSTAIMRCAAPHTSETTTSIVTIPSEDMKGRIIGKEGRNIRAIEQLTGVEVIIDETPLTIIVSGFSAIQAPDRQTRHRQAHRRRPNSSRAGLKKWWKNQSGNWPKKCAKPEKKRWRKPAWDRLIRNWSSFWAG